jgi:hypothetical protein
MSFATGVHLAHYELFVSHAHHYAFPNLLSSTEQISDGQSLPADVVVLGSSEGVTPAEILNTSFCGHCILKAPPAAH